MRLQGNNNNLFLVGPMAVGKTTIGRLLASELGLTFYDSDAEIERRAGANVAWIFDVEGEEQFRIRETKVIADLSEMQGVLVATGGGSVLREENRKHLINRGTVVFLDTSVDTQLRRTEKDKKRPLLQTDNPRAVLTELKTKRDPLYREVSDVRVFVGDGSSRKTVTNIMKQLKNEGLVA